MSAIITGKEAEHLVAVQKKTLLYLYENGYIEELYNTISIINAIQPKLVEKFIGHIMKKMYNPYIDMAITLNKWKHIDEGCRIHNSDIVCTTGTSIGAITELGLKAMGAFSIVSGTTMSAGGGVIPGTSAMAFGASTLHQAHTIGKGIQQLVVQSLQNVSRDNNIDMSQDITINANGNDLVVSLSECDISPERFYQITRRASLMHEGAVRLRDDIDFDHEENEFSLNTIRQNSYEIDDHMERNDIRVRRMEEVPNDTVNIHDPAMRRIITDRVRIPSGHTLLHDFGDKSGGNVSIGVRKDIEDVTGTDWEDLGWAIVSAVSVSWSAFSIWSIPVVVSCSIM